MKEVVLFTGNELALCSNAKLLAHRFTKTHQYVLSSTYCGVDFEESHFVAYYDEDEAECQKFYFGRIIVMLTKKSRNLKFIVIRYEHEVHEEVQAWSLREEGGVDILEESQLASHVPSTTIDMKEDGQLLSTK